MSKYRIRRKKSPKEEIRQEAKKINWKLWIVTLISVAAIFSVYQIAVYLRFGYILHIYCILAGVLMILYFFINRGFSGHKATYEDLPETWDSERKNAFLRDAEQRHRRAKKLLIPIIGILSTLAFDIVYLFYIEPML